MEEVSNQPFSNIFHCISILLKISNSVTDDSPFNPPKEDPPFTLPEEFKDYVEDEDERTKLVR